MVSLRYPHKKSQIDKLGEPVSLRQRNIAGSGDDIMSSPDSAMFLGLTRSRALLIYRFAIFLWGYLKSKVYTNKPHTIEELNLSIHQEIEVLPDKM